MTVPLFLLTVMVIVLVAGTVAVVLIRANGRSAPAATRAQGSASTAPAPAASASPSAAPSESGTVDRCLVGEWTVTTWRLPYSNQETTGDLATSNGGFVRFRADGTGEWDFGSGVKLVGSGPTRKIAVRLTGRFTFSFRTTGQTFEFSAVRADARQEVTESEEVTGAGAWTPQLGAFGYACAGDLFRWSPDEAYEVRLQRRG
jgi:hypothetical protein